MKLRLMLTLLVVQFATLSYARIGAALDNASRRQRFTYTGAIDNEDAVDRRVRQGSASEAPTGFDNRTNGFTPQGPPFETLNEDTVEPLRSFNDNRFVFEEFETSKTGSARHTTRRAAASATRMWSPAAPARWPNTALAAPSTASSSSRSVAR